MDTGMEVERERAVVRYRRLRWAVTLCRWFFEGLAALALLSWSSDRLPTALAACATLGRSLAAVLFHPASAFVLVNLIVVTLFAKSGGHAAEAPVSPLPPSPSTLGDAPDHPCYHSHFSAASPPRLYRVEKEEGLDVLYDDKAVCVESIATTTVAAAPTTDFSSVTASPQKGRQKGFPLPRTRSSDLPIAAVAKMRPGERLPRRSETYVGTRRRLAERWRPEEEVGVPAAADGRRRRLAAAEDEDDSEEFRLRIETFISKQLRFIEREEEELLLAANGATATRPGAVALLVAAGGPEYHCRR